MTNHTPEQSDRAAQTFLIDPAVLSDPFPPLAHLRACGPVVRVATPSRLGVSSAWLVIGMEAVVQVLKDQRFLLDPSTLSPTGEELAATLRFFGGRTLVNMDGLDHARLRGLVARVFTPRYIQMLRPTIQRITDELLDRVQAQGRMDVVRDFGDPLPIIVISEMLGVPQARREQFQHWSEAFRSLAAGTLEEQLAKLSELAGFVRLLLAEKRQRPLDDLLSQLVVLEADGDHLSEDELVGLTTLLIFAGHDTTAKMIAIGVLALFDHPEQLAQLQADLSLVPQAVEEFLRFNNPVLIPGPRFAAEDLELGGQQIRRGDMLLVSLAGASHDPAVFDDPEDLAIWRQISRQIAFGHGVHSCLGAPLARLEGEVAFTTLLRRMPGLRLDAPRDSLTWQGSLFLRGLTSLPVTF